MSWPIVCMFTHTHTHTHTQRTSCAHVESCSAFRKSRPLKISLVFPLLFFFPPLFFCTVHWRRPSCPSLLLFGTLGLVGCTFPFLPCFLLLFFLQLFIKPPQTTTLPSSFSISLRWFCSLSPVQYYRTPSIVLQAHCLLGLILWIYLLTPLHINRGFDLNCTWLA